MRTDSLCGIAHHGLALGALDVLNEIASVVDECEWKVSDWHGLELNAIAMRIKAARESGLIEDADEPETPAPDLIDRAEVLSLVDGHRGHSSPGHECATALDVEIRNLPPCGEAS